MYDYTLEEALDFINSKIDDAYTESRAIDREMERRGKLAKLLKKRYKISGDFKDLNDSSDAEDINRIMKRMNDYSSDFIPDRLLPSTATEYNKIKRKSAEKGREYSRSPEITQRKSIKKITGRPSTKERKPGYYLNLQKEKNAKKEELSKIDKEIAKLKKESVSNIYEAYCDDVIDAETAMDMILTIEASEY